MADLTLSQPERRSFLIPALLALAILGGVFALVIARTPHRIADLSVTHVAILPNHTVFKSGSRLVGAQDAASDDLYVVATVHIDDKLKLPLFIKDLTGTLDTPQGEANTSAVQKTELANLYLMFPRLQPLAGTPLLRESTIPPGQSAEGTVLLHFPVSEDVWNQRTSATITIDFYHQGPMTVALPKP